MAGLSLELPTLLMLESLIRDCRIRYSGTYSWEFEVKGFLYVLKLALKVFGGHFSQQTGSLNNLQNVAGALTTSTNTEIHWIECS